MPQKSKGKGVKRQADTEGEHMPPKGKLHDFKSICDNYLTILERFPEYIYVSDPDTHEVLFMNDKLRSLLKNPKPGMTCHQLLHGSSNPCDFCTNDIIARTNMPHVWENYNDYLNRHFLNTDQMITWHDGRKVRFETAIDITDQKKIEALLQATEKKYRSFIEQSTYGFFILNSNLEVTYLNDVAKGIYGLENGKEARLKLSEILGPEEFAQAVSRIQDMAAGEKVPMPHLYRFKRRDGQVRLVEIQSFPVWREDKLSGFHGTVLDITEREMAENALKEKSEFLDAVINNTSDGIFVIDEDIRYVLINPASGRILGHDPEEWIGKQAGTQKHPDDEEIAAEAFMKVVNGEQTSCEIRVKAKNGAYHLLEIRYSPMMLNDRFHVLGMVTDITERKKAENALRDSEEKYRNLFEQSPESIMLLDPELKIIECNRTTESIFDMKRSEIMGKTFPEVCGLDAKDAKYVGGIFESLVTGARGEGFEMELVRRRDGSEMWADIIPSIIREGETIQSVQIISKDITDSKRMQREMRKKVMRYVLDEGYIHLDADPASTRALDAFNEHLGVGFGGTLITRDSKKDYDKRIGSIFRCIRVSEVDNPDMDKYPPGRIAELLSGLPRGEVVLINCLEYCISRMGGKEAVRMVHDIRDHAVMRRLTVLLSADPSAISEADMRMIEKETRPLEPTGGAARLPAKIRAVLEYISELGREGINPSYSDIGKRFEVSKPTVRSWVEALVNAGAVEVVTKGRRKILRITEKGKIALVF